MEVAVEGKGGQYHPIHGGIPVGNFKAFPTLHRNYTKEPSFQVLLPMT